MEKLKASNYLQVIKFLLAGAIGASIEISLFVFLHEIEQMHYLVANLIAICVAILVNYYISQRWVFEDGRHSKKIEFYIFVFVSLIAISLNQFMMWVLVDQVSLEPTSSKILAIAFVAVYNFTAKKFLVFKR